MKLLFNELKLSLQDDEYEKTSITHIRNVARAFVVDNNKFALIHLYGKMFDDDKFEFRDYYETPGGGIENDETAEEGVLREIKEEIGCECEIITKLGIVNDYYNLLQRNNINHYFLLKVKSKSDAEPLDYEQKVFEKIYWLKIDEVILRYREMNNTPLARLVRNRELPMALLISDIIKQTI